MCGRYDFSVTQCTEFERVLTWKKCGGDPYDLAGWSGQMQVRDRPGGALLAEVAVTLGPDLGKITLRLTSAQTCAMPATCGVYELVLTDPDGEAHDLLSGSFAVRTAIVRPVVP